MSSRFYYFIILVFAFQSTTILAQKILKVQGNKVVISTRGIDVSEGDVLSVTSDGYEAGKVKILTVGSKTAVGKITEGSALKGDSVVASGGGSKKSSDDEDEDAPKSSKRKKSRSASGSGFGIHVGLGVSMLSSIASAQGDYTQDTQTGLFLMGEYRTGKSIYHFGLKNTSGSAEFTSKAAGLTITGAEVTTTNLFGRISNPIFKNFYVSYGGQFSMVSVEDNMTSGSGSGAHTLDLMGLGGLAGVGYDLVFGSFVIKAESLVEINYYFMNSSKVPGSSEFDTGAFMIYGLGINLSLGYRF